MKDAGYAIRSAYVSALSGHVSFNANPVPILDQVSSDTPFPYIYFSDYTQAEDKLMGHKEHFGQSVTITLTACMRYEGNSGTQKDVDGIMNQVMQLVRGITPQSPQLSFLPDFNNFGTDTVQSKFFKIPAVDKSVIYYRATTFRHNIQQLT